MLGLKRNENDIYPVIYLKYCHIITEKVILNNFINIFLFALELKNPVIEN